VSFSPKLAGTSQQFCEQVAMHHKELFKFLSTLGQVIPHAEIPLAILVFPILRQHPAHAVNRKTMAEGTFRGRSGFPSLSFQIY